jgi:hypothetical protein
MLNPGEDNIDMVADLGYRSVLSLTLLGFKLDHNGPMTDIIFQELYQRKLLQAQRTVLAVNGRRKGRGGAVI